METHCPICGAPYSRVEMVLADRERNFQCRRCWTAVHKVMHEAAGAPRQMKPKTVRRVHAHEPRRHAA